MEQLLNDAKKGGYNIRQSSHVMLYDPELWQAVSKTRGWGSSNQCSQCGHFVKEEDVTSYWEKVMHKMLDAKINGINEEEFISSLLKE